LRKPGRALQRLEAVEILATNEDLRRENGETFEQLRARQLPDHRRMGAQRNSIPPTDEER
jgi:hypothetical protein